MDSHGFCKQCFQTWKCSACGENLTKLETRPQSGKCSRCGGGHVGKCYSSGLAGKTCGHESSNACAVNALEIWFIEHGFESRFCYHKSAVKVVGSMVWRMHGRPGEPC